MARVQLQPWWWVAGGVVALFLAAMVSPLSVGGAIAGSVYLVVTSALLTLGLSRRRADRFGPANAVTATRSVLIGVVTAVVVTSFTQHVTMSLVVLVATIALALDGVDGFVARRTHSESELGARFDMEADAFLMLVLSVYDARFVGFWILTIGVMRYAFVAVGWVFPWMRARLPFRYWRKVVAATCGIVLVIVASGLMPTPWNYLLAALALGLLLESFGRDVVWLIRHRSSHELAAR